MAYCSWRAPDVDDDELVWLVQCAQARNLGLGVTSALFVAGDQFLQVLEGPREPVAWLYHHIADDYRHDFVVNVLDGPIAQRAFDGWSLRLMSAGDLKAAELSAVRRSLAWVARLGEAAPEALGPDDFVDCRAALAACAGREAAAAAVSASHGRPTAAAPEAPPASRGLVAGRPGGPSDRRR
jgi:hypothetical protein